MCNAVPESSGSKHFVEVNRLQCFDSVKGLVGTSRLVDLPSTPPGLDDFQVVPVCVFVKIGGRGRGRLGGLMSTATIPAVA